MIHTLFPSLVYETNLKDTIQSETHETVYKKSLEFRKNDNNKASKNWECFTTINKIDLLKLRNFRIIIDECTKHVEDFLKECGYLKKIKCVSAWVNIDEPGNFHDYHTHPTPFTAVYYIRVPENSGDIVFLNIFDYFSHRGESSPDRVFKVKDYDLLVFKGNLAHKVTQNKSNEDRVVISMNFDFCRDSQT